MSSKVQQPKTRWSRFGVAAVVVGLGVVGGCDNLLEVDLPDAVTEEALETPSTAALQVNSVMASVECGYSSFAIDAAGYEDNFQRYSGVAGLYSEYRDTPGGGGCDGDAYSSEWMDPMLIARAQGYDTYERISNWTDAQVSNRQQLLAKTALYTAIPLDIFGEFFCETTVDEGSLMTPTQTLDLAEEWVNTALGHISTTGDFAITAQQGTIASSAEDMAYGLRARIKWAKGDLAGAAADAALVPNGFIAYVLREEGEDRRNMVSSMQGGGGGVQAAGFLQGPITEKSSSNDYGVSILGNNPVTGEPWPDPVPFTGYLDLGFDAQGLTLDANNNAITTATGVAADTRVKHVIGNTAGGPDNIIQKYESLADDIPLINWAEMRLIQAQAANEGGNQAGAIALINQLRTAAGLPTITATGLSQERVENLIIEERRRALWLEGRFWSTKIQNTDKLWFPRRTGDWVNAAASYVLNGGVRVLMDEDEYQINPNLTLADRGTGCSTGQAPIFN